MDTSRLETFSDGVFAIAITLLVLEIKVPSSGSALGRELLSLWPSYLAYAVSFIVIGAIWINHHAMFDHIVRVDHMLLLLNTFHLMFIAFIPFPTAVLAQALHDRINEPFATSFYGGILTVIGVLVNAMWRYATHEHRLLSKDISQNEAKRISHRFLVGPIFYGISTIVALITPWLALTFYIALNVFFLWPHQGHTNSTKTSRLFRGTLLVIQAFVALTGVGGGILMAMGIVKLPPESRLGIPFSSYFVPSVLLTILVGASSAAGFLAVFRRNKFGWLISLIAGLLMVGWIVLGVLIF